MSPEQNDFFTILPSNVRYDSNLSDFAKVLFSEIFALSKKNGFCWATNEHFAGLFSKHETTVSRAISELKNQNYIQIETTNSKNGTVRNITPLSENAKRAYSKNAKTPISDNAKTPLSKNAKTPISDNAKTPLSKNAKHNNTSIKKNKKNNSLEENIFDKRKAKQLPFDVVSSSETIRATFQKPFSELKQDIKNIFGIDATDNDIETAIKTFSTVAVAQYPKYKCIQDYNKLCDMFKAWIDTSIKFEGSKPKEQPQDLETYLLEIYKQRDIDHFKQSGKFEKWETLLKDNLFRITKISEGYKSKNITPLFVFEIMYLQLGENLNGSSPDRKLESFKKLFDKQTEYNRERGNFREIIKQHGEKQKA